MVIEMAAKSLNAVGKDVARLLAENRATVSELGTIFAFARSYLVFSFNPSAEDGPKSP